ncbi:uncharacterized protein [Montipora foliosa]|uniref:uncharacterized protein n=1 Tax=Montipora foliosa TaxID=591990 RepID=UPI0035F12912
MAFFYKFRVFIALTFVACCLQLGETKNCEITSEIKKATTFVMRKCNSNIKDYYEKNAGEHVQTTYCEGMRILMNCARRWTENFKSKFNCTSDTLQEWVFVALQYVVISKKLHFCNYNTTKLRKLVRKLGFEKDPLYMGKSIVRVAIPDNATRQCGRWIHRRCARNLMQEANLCTGVSTFVSCYNEHVSRFPYVNGKCGEQVPEITQKFNTLIQQFSTDLIGKYKYSLNQERMCLVDKSVVDTESYSRD